MTQEKLLPHAQSVHSLWLHCWHHRAAPSALTWEISPARGRQKPLWAPMLISCSPFPVAFFKFSVLGSTWMLSQTSRFRQKPEYRKTLIANYTLWEMGCCRLSMSKGTGGNFKGWRAWTCRLFSSVWMLHERTVVEASESTSEMLAPQATGCTQSCPDLA